jgi:phosphatidylglycerol:prolipoprotein diacylglycerol transferase
MYPYLHFLNFTVPTYSVLGITGILLGWLFSVRHGLTLHRDKDDCTFLYMYGFIGGILGAKLLPILLNLPAVIMNFGMVFTDPQSFAAEYLGGLVFYGGLIGGILGALLYCRIYRIRFSDYLPVVIPAVPLVHAIGRIGCFCAGCCYGKPCDAWFGIIFSISPEAPNGVRLIPTQLLESACLFILFIVLWRYSLKCSRNLNMLSAYLIAYGIIRFLIEFLRGDEIRGFYGPLSTSQWISVAAVLTGIGFLFYQYTTRKVNVQ